MFFYVALWMGGGMVALLPCFSMLLCCYVFLCCFVDVWWHGGVVAWLLGGMVAWSAPNTLDRLAGSADFLLCCYVAMQLVPMLLCFAMLLCNCATLLCCYGAVLVCGMWVCCWVLLCCYVSCGAVVVW